MINLRVLLLLGAAIVMAAAQAEEPDCSACEYNDNIGYIKSQHYCRVYYVCRVNPYKANHYKWERMCCPAGQEFDPEHLTCTWLHNEECDDTSEFCPIFTTVPYEEFICPYYALEVDCQGEEVEPCFDLKRYRSKVTYAVFECPYGSTWIDAICGCDYGEEFHNIDEGCQENRRQLLGYYFDDDSFDSYVCHNFASGIPYGTASISEDGQLCLNGDGSYLQIPYLYNWFAWNDIALSFTMCIQFHPNTVDDQGLFATHCSYEVDNPGPEYRFIDIFISGGTLQVTVAGFNIDTGVAPPTDRSSSVCLEFHFGEFLVYYSEATPIDGNPQFFGALPGVDQVFPPNSHSAASLGYAPDYGYFNGCINNFSFWTYVDEQNQLVDNFGEF